MLIINKKGRQDVSRKDWENMQQPLDERTGRSNENFNKLYGKDKNPFTNTDRDVEKKKFRVYT